MILNAAIGRGAWNHSIRCGEDERQRSHAGIIRENYGPPVRRWRPGQDRLYRGCIREHYHGQSRLDDGNIDVREFARCSFRSLTVVLDQAGSHHPFSRYQQASKIALRRSPLNTMYKLTCSLSVATSTLSHAVSLLAIVNAITEKLQLLPWSTCLYIVVYCWLSAYHNGRSISWPGRNLLLPTSSPTVRR